MDLRRARGSHVSPGIYNKEVDYAAGSTVKSVRNNKYYYNSNMGGNSSDASQNDEHDSPEQDLWIHATYQIDNYSPTRLIFSGANTIRQMKIDGVTVEVSTHTYTQTYRYIQYTFPSIGKHVVDFLMIDEEECRSIVEEDPSPEYLSFYRIDTLTEIELPYNIILNEGEFSWCSNLRKITCNAITAPWINLSSREYNPTPTFFNIPTNGILCIPEGSDYSLWIDPSMGTNLGTYGWTVEGEERESGECQLSFIGLENEQNTPLPSTGGAISFLINTTCEWSVSGITGGNNWLTIDCQSGPSGTTPVRISASSCSEQIARSATFVFTSGSVTKNLRITQNIVSSPKIQLIPMLMTIGVGQSSNVNLTVSNVDEINGWYWQIEKSFTNGVSIVGSLSGTSQFSMLTVINVSASYGNFTLTARLYTSDGRLLSSDTKSFVLTGN